MAEIAVAGWVVAPIIKIIVDKVQSYIGRQYNWCKDIQRDLEKLVIALTSIQTVVAVAERQESLNTSQQQLLSLLKDAVYEADDLLDEYEYRRLEAQAMEARGMVSHGASSALEITRRLIGQDEFPRKLEEILNKLDNVSQWANKAQLGGSTITSVIEQGVIRHDRDTSSFPTSEILGRDTEKEELISLLHKITDEPISNYTNIPIITIVGLGGIGKTTLAQYVYHDRRIKGLFDLRMWICVSDNFDEKTLTRKILECASESNEKHKDMNNLNILKENLKKELESKKFLLVLDDVWINEKSRPIEAREIWKKILAPVKDGIRGSKILVTTRENRVATILGTTSFIYLDGLNDEENWSIVKMNAFGNKIPDNHQELEEIGKKIIKKLQGSPLAACVVGTMLRDTMSSDPKSLLQNLQMESLEDVMSVLRLSYKNLDFKLKPCFSYCSIFPKDSQFRPEKLVLLWIAQGYVNRPRGDGRSLTDIGMDYFNQLLSRSFFQKSEQASSKCYIMHDIIHDLAQNVSLDECFRIDSGKRWEIPQTIRHLGVHFRSDEEFKNVVLGLEKMNNIKNLRSLMFFGGAYLFSTSHLLLVDMLKRLSSLRVLDLNELRLGNFKGELSHLLHLRYLHLGRNSSTVLPGSVSRLYHLTCLCVQYLQVNVDQCIGFTIGALQGVKVGFPERLRINNLQYCRGREEALQADLGSKHCLNRLELEWGSSGRIVGHDADAEVAEALKPHPNLKHLIIKGFRGSRLPSWLEREWLLNLRSRRLSNLKSLHLNTLRILEVSNCPNWTSFPLFPRTPRDIFLPIAGSVSLLNLESSPPESFVLTIYSIFQSDRDFLHDQQVRAIHELWIEDGKEAATPAGIAKAATLKKLSIKWCPELLMSNQGMFQSLMIDDFPDTDSWLSRCLQAGLTSLSKLKIINCTGLMSLPSATMLQSLTALQVLKIWRCKDLTSLGGLHAFVALKKLQIIKCPALLTSEKDGRGVLPSSLDTLLLYDFPLTNRWLSRCLQGSLTSLSVRIGYCSLKLVASEEEDSNGVLPSSLELLEINHCTVTVRWLSRCLQGGLTSLSVLRLEYCSLMLVTSEEEDGHDVLPSSLESLEIQCCSVTDRWLFRFLQGGLTSLSKLKITNCTGLTSLPSVEVLQSLTALQMLSIRKSTELTSLGGLHSLTTLKHLQVEDCPKVKSLPEGAMPASIEHLILRGCNRALQQQLCDKKGPDWEKVARIPCVWI